MFSCFKLGWQMSSQHFLDDWNAMAESGNQRLPLWCTSGRDYRGAQVEYIFPSSISHRIARPKHDSDMMSEVVEILLTSIRYPFSNPLSPLLRYRQVHHNIPLCIVESKRGTVYKYLPTCRNFLCHISEGRNEVAWPTSWSLQRMQKAIQVLISTYLIRLFASNTSLIRST